MLVYGRDAEVAEWVGDHIPYVGAGNFGPCAAIGVECSGKLIAGVVFHDWIPAYRTVQISIAAISPMWARRENIRELLLHPFGTLDAFKAWTLIPIDNAKAIKVNRHIGFVHEAILPHQYGRDRHADMAGMLRPEFDLLYGVN